MAFLKEADLESFLMSELAALGHSAAHGSTLAPDIPNALRSSYHDTILEPVLLEALRRINPVLPVRALVEASKKLLDVVFATDVLQENRRIHRLLVDGIKTSYVDGGEERNAVVRLGVGLLLPNALTQGRSSFAASRPGRLSRRCRSGTVRCG